MTAQKPAAVLLGLDTMQGLQAARILAARGVPVIGIVADRRHHTARTNSCRRVIEVARDADLPAELARLGLALGSRAVLIPCHDRHVLMISAHRNTLEQWYEFVLPDHDVIEMLMDKAKFAGFAQEHAIPTPITFALEPGDDIHEVAEKMRYPCAMKPSYRTSRWVAATSAKGFKIESPEKLIDLYSQYAPLADGLLIQEWIEGDPSHLYSFNGYFDRDGRLLVSFIARKLRQWPPDTGQSSLGEEVREDAVLDISTRLLEAASYRGLAYVEVKKHARTGEYFVVEPNVGRPTGRSAIAEGGGVELLYTAYCDALGSELPIARTQRYTGIKWIHLRRDLQSVIATWRRDRMTPARWWRSFKGPKVYAVWSARDPLPFIFDLWEAIRTGLSRSEG